MHAACFHAGIDEPSHAAASCAQTTRRDSGSSSHQGNSMFIRPALLTLLASVSVQSTAADVPHITSHRGNATSALSISPIFSQLVAFKMPLSFHVVNEHTSAHAYIREAVPNGETADQWTQMITVTGYKGIAASPDASPVDLAANNCGRLQEKLS